MAVNTQLLTLPDIVELHAAIRPDAVALEYEDRRITFAQLKDQSARIAAALQAQGVRPGDRVAFLDKNSELLFLVLIACGRLNAAFMPISWRLATAETAYLLSDAEPKVIFASSPFLDSARAAIAASGIDTTLVLLDGETSGAAPTLTEWSAAHLPLHGGPRAATEDICLILYTSGTTGRPKGAMLPHRAFVEMRRLEALHGPDWLKWSPADVCLVCMPLFHIGGIRTAIAALYNGAQLHILREFDEADILRVVSKRPVKKLFLVPSAMQALARHPLAATTDFGNLEYVVYGAAAISPALLRECLDVFGCGFIQAYGSTETTGGVLALGPEDHDPNGGERMSSAGKPVTGVELKIMASDGSAQPPGEIGEVVIRSPTNMIGYWGLPEVTRETLNDGWVRTGDAGFVDDEGYLFLRDRLKDMIISGGENIYPIEVENALSTHPAVAEVAVVGVPSQRWGEAVKAVVVLRAGATATERELIDWTKTLIATFKAPKSIDFVTSLPRTSNGKVLKRDLRASYAVA